jgi:hypothetical protein
LKKKYLPSMHMRSPRTTQEKRQYFSALDQGYKPRAQRNPRNLPDAWDDISIKPTDWWERKGRWI